jgi:hypothetical protein
MVAANFGVFQVFLSMVWFFLFFVWIMLLFRVFADIFRSGDLGGVAKVLWLVFTILTPYLGVFVYLIVRGRSMTDRELSRIEASEAATASYIRSVAGASTSAADELARLADLKDRGVIDDAEFAAMKAKLIG